MRLFRAIDGFFFRSDSATSFGLMRAVWAAAVFFTMLLRSNNITRFYSETGMLPAAVQPLILRQDHLFGILQWVSDPQGVLAIYVILLLSCIVMFFGIYARASTIISVLLFFSFNERNPLILGGGDTVLRVVGLLLIIAPSIHAFSLPRLGKQWRLWSKKRTLLPPLTMPAWPRILLLWQLIVLYSTSLWDKMYGDMWWQGTAVAATLHQGQFSRLPWDWVTPFVVLSAPLTWGTTLFEAMWLLLLIPRPVARFLPWKSPAALKRLLIIGGIIFHGSIFLFMEVGSFSGAMFTAYIGLITQEDIEAIRRWWNSPKKKREHSIAILYDGHCGLCQRSVFAMQLFDAFHRITPVDYHNLAQRQKVAPHLRLQDLDRAMHIKLSDGRMYRGFDAMRVLTWHLPVFWLVAPFLYIPGIPQLGRLFYARIAARRILCKHGDCRF